MTNQIAPLSEEKLLKIFPGYFSAEVSGTWAKIGDRSILRGEGKLAGGTTADEKFQGRGGSDVITAGPPPDASATIAKFGAGDYGDDFLGGDPGDDVLVGGQGDNTIYGGRGDDYIYGDQLQINRSTGSTPNGTPSAPIRSDNDGNDVLYAGRGNDFVHGGGGDANFLQGGPGNDTLLGAGTKRDVLDGGDGHDYLISGDTPFTAMEGGSGNDVFDITNLGGDVKILDFSDGDKIKLPSSDSFAVLYGMITDEIERLEGSVEWDWEWVATETDDGVTIPLDNGTLYLAGDVDFDDLTLAVSGGTFEIT